ncbi:MAG: hypothetical protein JRG94_25200 [Deltaproteobacteria bacterium]|nr:hypothetical protein [Deltaproteobacteria bacterium]
MTSDLVSEALDLPEARAARYWLGLAVGVLVLAGFFSLMVLLIRRRSVVSASG